MIFSSEFLQKITGIADFEYKYSLHNIMAAKKVQERFIASYKFCNKSKKDATYKFISVNSGNYAYLFILRFHYLFLVIKRLSELKVYFSTLDFFRIPFILLQRRLSKIILSRIFCTHSFFKKN